MNRRSVPPRHVEPQRDTPHRQGCLKVQTHSHSFEMTGVGVFIVFIVLCSSFPTHGFAQVGNCEQSTGEAYLDAGNVLARIPNNGALFWRGAPDVYEVPKGSGKQPIFSASLSIGGLMNDELRIAGSSFGPWEFWSGPLDQTGAPPADCSIYDQVWEIRTEDIETFLNTGAITHNLASWPWHLGAPVVDKDGDPSNYNLEGGDLPELFGDQRLWWIMNDMGNAHTRTDSKAMGLEIHSSAFAFDTHTLLGDYTFYEYEIINKNTIPLSEAYFGMFMEMELGHFSDDFVGSDTLLHLAFAYNADNDDQHARGYGKNPPAMGLVFLESFLSDNDGLDNDHDSTIDEPGEQNGIASFISFVGGSGIRGDPGPGRDFYYSMRGLWKDGNPIVTGGTGHPNIGGEAGLPHRRPTRYIYHGEPATRSFWSEMNIDGEGTTGAASQRQAFTSTGPFTLAPADTITVRFAIIWARGRDHLNSVTKLKEAARNVRNSGNDLYRFVPPPAPIAPIVSHVLGFDQNFPNPFTQSTTLRYSLPQSMHVRLAVYDVLGREVALLADAQQEAGIYTLEFDAGELPAGLYLARIELDHLRFTKRMMKVD